MGPPNLFSHQFLFCCALKPHAKFQNPMITHLGWKVSWAEREREKNAVNSGHLVLWQHTQTARTQISRPKLPICTEVLPIDKNLQYFWHQGQTWQPIEAQRRWWPYKPLWEKGSLTLCSFSSLRRPRLWMIAWERASMARINSKVGGDEGKVFKTYNEK